MYQYLRFILLITIGLVTSGCAFEEEPFDIKRSDSQILTGSWQVEDIDQRGVIDNAMVTLQFEDENKISGSTGCNRFNGTVTIQNDIFVVSQVASTRRACVPAVARQEQLFLAALNDATRHEVENNTWLIVYDSSDMPRLKLIQQEP